MVHRCLFDHVILEIPRISNAVRSFLSGLDNQAQQKFYLLVDQLHLSLLLGLYFPAKILMSFVRTSFQKNLLALLSSQLSQLFLKPQTILSNKTKTKHVPIFNSYLEILCRLCHQEILDIQENLANL